MNDTENCTSSESQELLKDWLSNVIVDWRTHWADRPDHRYGRDMAAFIGERLLTDFELRKTPGLIAAEMQCCRNRS